MTTESMVLLGGSGFIGSALARELDRLSEAVRIADIQPSAAFPRRWVRADVRSADDVAGACQADTTLFLLAGEHGLAPRPAQRFDEVNVGGARAVVTAAERVGLNRIVFTSTVAVYGRFDSVADERSACRPGSDYGRTKLAAEGVLQDWAARDATRSLVIVRPTMVFGGGVRGHARALLLHLAHPRFVMIGTGTNRKSLAHVDNLAAFLAYLRRAAPGTHLFNYADGPDLTLAELADLVRTAIQLGPLTSRRSQRRALLISALQSVGLDPARGEPSLRLAQVRSFCADSRFESTRLAATGFRPPRPLADAVVQYARSDLRWAVPTAFSAAQAEVHVSSA